jgi:PAS domain S-box-containing protein
MTSGHVLVGPDGRVLSTDRGFSEILRTDPKSIVGRHVIDITAPADRAECCAAIADLRRSGIPFEISKRMIREDGSLVWVTNTVSMVGHGGDEDVLVATIRPIADLGDMRAPALLLDCAQMLISIRHDRSSVLSTSMILDTAWDVLLAAYVAEAKGRSIDVPGLARRARVSETRAGRWIAALLKEGALEIETRLTDPHAPKSFRLTSGTHASLESYLAKVGEKQIDVRAEPRVLYD